MSTKEPVAIVGMGCRFPAGAGDPDALWRLLLDGVDAMVEVPKDRWDHRRFYDPDPDRPGKIYVKEAAFLRERIDEFDGLAFGISPREAHYMDPQQRVLLEVAWEAFDDAGIPLESVRGQEVGVFVGGFTLDSMVTQLAYENQHIIGSHSGPGATMTMLANRVSYDYDLRGPSVPMDTACTSSLVATHFACQAIWNGECDMALTGGVNLMLRPGFPIVMCKGGFLSPHGRCMAFDERAAGYARGEGAGVAVLKPLRKALEDGDRIYATVLASGVNQDGRTQGISLPNGDAQARLVDRVIREADVAPRDISYVEAHGTGTQAGDPTEAGALNQVLREGRGPDEKAWLGSIKTNIGHLEAAAGVAGLLKAALVLHHGQVPRNLHFERPNPKIPFDRMSLRVPTETQPLPADRPAVAGVNSFGYGGANAHVVLRQHTDAQVSTKAERPGREGLFLTPITARDPEALAARAGQIAAALDDNDLADVAYTLTHRASHHNHRLAVVAETKGDLAAKLRHYAESKSPDAGVVGQVTERPKTAFVFTGMGPQWWAMGRELIAAEPVFAAAIDEVDARFAALAGWSLKDALLADEASSRMARTEVAQPTNFAIQYALTRLWAAWGIQPDAVVGHSVGEVGAAFASGALDLEDAVQVSFHRSRLQATTAGRGTMLAVGLGEDTAAELCTIYDGVSVAAVNGRNAVTLAGDEASLKEVAQGLEAEGVFQKMLTVEVAYHSHQMEPIREELTASLSGLRPRRAEGMALYSTVTGAPVAGDELDAAYWWRNVREPVRFAKAMEQLIADGYTCFVEVGPHPVLRTSIAEAIRAEGVSATSYPSIRRAEPEVARMLETLGALWTLGHKPRWDAVSPTDGDLVRLPTYPFQRTRYWNESEASLERVGAQRSDPHPLLETRVVTARPTWETELSPQILPWIEDHKVGGTVILPGAAYVETALAAARHQAEGRHVVLKDLDFHRLLSVEPKRVVDLQVECDVEGGTWRIASAERGSGQWHDHANGFVVTDNPEAVHPPRVDLLALRKQLNGAGVMVGRLYRQLAGRGLEYGPDFQTLTALHPHGDEVLARLELPRPEEAAGYVIHPALLDGAFQAVVSLVGESRDGSPLVPTGLDRVEVFEPVGPRAWAHMKLLHHTAREVQADLQLLGEDGQVLATLDGLTLQPIPTADAEAADERTYVFEWQERDRTGSAAGEGTTVLALGDPGILDGLQTALSAQGARVRTARLGQESFDEPVDRVVLFVPRAGDAPVDEVEALGLQLVQLVKRMAARSPAPSLCLVSPLSGEGSTGLLGTPLWGLARVARAELADMTIRSVAVAFNGNATWARLAEEVLSDDPETEVRLVGERREARRLVTLEPEQAEASHETQEVVTTEQNVVLAIDQVGSLGSLHWRAIPRRAPAEREIEVRVEASGINFKDLLKFTGQLNPRVTRSTFLGDACGMECVGEVVRVGPGVTRFRVGDRVLAAPAEGSFQGYVTTDETTATIAPKTLSATDAAILLPYLTAWHGLMNIARLEEGETVLIHSAAGGVGQCAVSIAKMVGAKIIATAGSEEKRQYLREQGIERVTDSRSLAFVQDVRAWTDGRGVDVVLSALTTDGLLESVRLLAPCGRFVDIGKKAFIDNDALPLRIFNDGLTYASIDMDRMFLERMPFCIDVVAKCIEKLDEGALSPMPTQVFKASEAVDAFRTMAQGRHIGRMVIALDRQRVDARLHTGDATDLIRQDGTYVVTGGLGGFGLEVAKWLAEEGAGALLLLGRRGLETPGAPEAVAQLEAKGVRVFAEAVDVSRADDLERALAKARAVHPIRGVFHCAMVLADELLRDLREDSWRRVLLPKARGAWHLHRLTDADPVDHFVGFSSVAVAIGNAGQASYVVANAFLDGLAAYRRARGKAGLSIQWGVLKEVGVVTRHAQVGDALEASGMQALTTEEALEGLRRTLTLDRPEVGVFGVDWERFTLANPTVAAQPIFAKVRGGAGRRASPALALARELLLVDPEERVSSLADRLRQELSGLLRVDPSQIGFKQSLTELGVDSLLALELVSALQSQGIEVNVVDLMQGPTLQTLAERTVDQLADILRQHAEDLLASVDDMAEEEVEALVAFLGQDVEGPGQAAPKAPATPRVGAGARAE
ncbi:MAG: SDR family NAD(P)-dependent oxidoreductase [Sandaracinaceae bacterium]